MLVRFKQAALCLSILVYSQGKAYTGDPADSIKWEKQLKEVKVTATDESSDPVLRFYKSNKTAGTEDILARMQGLSLIRRGSYGMEPSLRGLSGAQLNVTIDGMKIFGACTDRMDPPTVYIETANLKSIESATGSSGSMYGSTIGGALNFKLDDAQFAASKSFSGSIASSYYSAAQSTSNVLQLNYGEDNWALRLAGVYRKAGNYRDGGNRAVPFTQYEKLNLSLNAKYKINGNSFLKADLLSDDGWNMGYAALPMDVGFARTRMLGLSYKAFFDERAAAYLEAKVYGNKIEHSMDDTRRENITMHMDMPGWSDTYGAFVETALSWHPDQRLTLRADTYRNSLRAEMTMYPDNSVPMFMLTWPDNRRYVAGLYADNQFNIDSAKSISLSARLDYANSFVNTEEGRQQLSAFNYQLDKPVVQWLKSFNAKFQFSLPANLRATLGLGYGERLPGASEMFGFYLFNRYDGYDYVGNPFIGPERSVDGEASLGYKTHLIQLNVTGFYSRIRDYIAGIVDPSLSVMTPGANGVKVYTSRPHATLRGAELDFSTHFGEKAFFISSVKYTYGKGSDKQPLPMIAPLKMISSFRYLPGKLSLQAETEWAAAQKRINSDMGERPSPAWFIATLRASYGFDLRRAKIEIHAGVENLFNRSYFEHLDWGQINRPGRNIYTSVACSF